MVQVIVFAVVLVAVFALKVVAMTFGRDALVGKQAVFSWMAPRADKVEAVRVAAVEEPARAEQKHVAVHTKRVPA